MQQQDPNQTEWAKTAQPFEVQNPPQQQNQIPNQYNAPNPYAQPYGQQQYGQQQQVSYGQPIPMNPYQQQIQMGAPVGQNLIVIPPGIGNNPNLPTPYNANGAPYPIQIICPVCRTQGITTVTAEIGAGTYLVSYLLFLCTGICCCWVPCVMPDCQDKVHRCSSCQAEVGIRQYDMC